MANPVAPDIVFYRKHVSFVILSAVYRENLRRNSPNVISPKLGFLLTRFKGNSSHELLDHFDTGQIAVPTAF